MSDFTHHDLPLNCGKVTRIQIGEAMPFAREQTSAINKFTITEAEVNTLGIVGDEQADPFFHGGQFQAIHQMPASVYPLIKVNFPEVTIYEGMLGENLIIGDADQTSMNESNVCVGDIYQIGTVKMQVTRPRKPCWKIDAQLNSRGIAKFLLDEGCIGWYYRIVQNGHFKLDDECQLIDRPEPDATLSSLWHTFNHIKDSNDPQLQYWLNNEYLVQSFKSSLKKRAR